MKHRRITEGQHAGILRQAEEVNQLHNLTQRILFIYLNLKGDQPHLYVKYGFCSFSARCKLTLIVTRIFTRSNLACVIFLSTDMIGLPLLGLLLLAV